MPEDAAPDAAQDTPDAPEPAAPEGTPAESQEDSPAQEVDWQDRYEHLHPEYTRATQEASQYRQIIDLARQGDPEALAVLGLEVEEGDEEDEDDFADPDERWEQRFGEIEGYLQERAEAEAEAELEGLESQYLDQEIGALAKKENTSFTDEERDAILGLADRMRDDEGIPDVNGAYELLTKASEARQQRYLKSKKADRVEVGTAGTEKVNLDDDDARIGLMADMIEANSQD